MSNSTSTKPAGQGGVRHKGQEWGEDKEDDDDKGKKRKMKMKKNKKAVVINHFPLIFTFPQLASLRGLPMTLIH